MNASLSSQPQAADRRMFIAFELLRDTISSGPGNAEPPSLDQFMAELQIRRRQALALFLRQSPPEKIRAIGESLARTAGMPLVHVALRKEWLGDEPPAAREQAIELLAAASLAQSTSSSENVKRVAVDNHNTKIALRCSQCVRSMLASSEGLAMLPDVISSMSLALSVKNAGQLKTKIFLQSAMRIFETGHEALPAFIAMAPPDWASAATAVLNGEALPLGGEDKGLALALAFGGQFPALEPLLDRALAQAPDSPSQALDMAAVFSLLDDSPWSSRGSPIDGSAIIRGGAATDAELSSCAEMLHGWSHGLFRWPSACPEAQQPLINATMASIFQSWPSITSRNEAQLIENFIEAPCMAHPKTGRRL